MLHWPWLELIPLQHCHGLDALSLETLSQLSTEKGKSGYSFLSRKHIWTITGNVLDMANVPFMLF